MRAKLMELTPESRTRSRNGGWLNIAFTSAWQSSKVPSMAMAWMLSSSAVVIMRRCTSETRPWGNSTTTSTWARPRKRLDGGAAGVAGGRDHDGGALAARAQRMIHQARQELHRQVLEGERRPVKQLEHEGVRRKLHQRHHGRMAEARHRLRAPCGRVRRFAIAPPAKGAITSQATSA